MAIPAEVPLGEQTGLSGADGADSGQPGWSGETFRNFFLEHYTRLAGVVSRMVGDSSRAEDLAIEAFWRLYRNPCSDCARFNPGGWVYRAATRLALDHLRAEARRGRYEQQAGPSLAARPGPDPLAGVLAAEKRAQVRKVLVRLRPEQAQLLILRASGFSYQELADILGVTRGSIGTRLIRAEAAFRKRYLRLHRK